MLEKTHSGAGVRDVASANPLAAPATQTQRGAASVRPSRRRVARKAMAARISIPLGLRLDARKTTIGVMATISPVNGRSPSPAQVSAAAAATSRAMHTSACGGTHRPGKVLGRDVCGAGDERGQEIRQRLVVAGRDVVVSGVRQWMRPVEACRRDVRAQGANGPFRACDRRACGSGACSAPANR